MIKLVFLLLILVHSAHSSKIFLTQKEKDFIKQHPKINLASSIGFEPFVIPNYDKTISGYERDLLDIVTEKTGLKFSITLGKWSEMQTKLDQRMFDGFPSAAYIKNREKLYNRSDTYLKFTTFVVTKKDNPKKLLSVNDLEGKKVAVQKDNKLFEEIINDLDKNITVLKLDTLEDTIKAVVSSKVDFIVLDETVFYLAKQIGLNSMIEVPFTIGEPFDIMYWFRNDYPELTTIFNKALRSIDHKKKLKLRDKWFSKISDDSKLFQHIDLTNSEKNYLEKKAVINMCVNPKVLPYESIDKNGEYQGIGSDIMEIISKNIDKPIQLIPTKNWTESIENFKAKECDILPLVIYAPERKTYMNYTKPYIKESVVIATKNDAFFINDSNDLSDKKIGVVNGYLFMKMLKQNNPAIEIINVKNAKEGLEKVKQGELFGYVDALSVVAYQIQQNSMIDLKIAGKLEFTIDICIATRKDEPALNNIIQKALDNIEPQQIKSIVGKWIQIKIEELIDYKIVIYIILFFLSILTVIIYKNRSIHKISKNLAFLNKQILKKNELLEKMSSTDSLTKLPNRLLLEDRISLALNGAKRNKTVVACCLIDLDGFKEVNDTYGHDAGDYVLVEASKRMLDSTRNVDTVARLGGDEFVILLTDLDTSESSVKSLDRVLHSLSQTYTYNNQNIDSISASIGVSLYPNDDKNPETLLKDADIAMYKSKNSGKNKYSFFEAVSEYKITQNEHVLKKIKKAFEKDEFILYYQPKLDVQTAKIKEVEALARWKHPILGILPPAEFIPLILKDTELSLLFDKWVIIQALKQVEHWQKNRIDLKVCVNVSSKYFSCIDDKSKLCKLIEESNIPKNLLRFLEYEILENDILNHQKEFNTTFKECRAFGSTFALDDFGTGYSSLMHIKNLNVDTIKIDKSFVKEINSNTTNKTIVESINKLAKAFGMRVTAEGAETLEEIQELINIGCDSIQGYVISHPLTIEDLEKFLKDFSNHKIYKYIKENNGNN